MRRLTLAVVMFFLPVITIYGQENMRPVSDPASMELNLSRTLWFNSSNAAGMAVAPLQNYNIVSARYDHTSGDYKLMQRGDRESSMIFNTNGALKVGKVALWGDFNFSNDYWKGTTFNTGLFELDPDMPYYVSDRNKGNWNKQSYDMSVKAATPLFWNRVAVGLHFNYTTRKAAKQIDPRGVTTGYGIFIAPSSVVRITDNHYVGVNFNYKNTFERINFTNVVESSQTVYLMKGLGNFTSDVLQGTSGVGTYYYPKNIWGAGLQYGYSGTIDILLDFGYNIEKNEAFQYPNQPKPM
jgi:hypothetical protein